MHPKEIAAHSAVQNVQSGQVLGLGTGSTVAFALQALARRVREEKLSISGVPTSIATEEECRRLGISLTTLSANPQLDVDIDGADQVDANFQVIKGYGGALLREKIVARSSRLFWVIVDPSKLSQQLDIALPVEVLPFGSGAARRELKALGGKPTLRQVSGAPFVSDNGNHILDVDFGVINQAAELANKISRIPAVMEHGLFVDLASEVHVGEPDGAHILKRS